MVDLPRLDAYHFYEREWSNYDDLYEQFDWQVPSQFNIAAYVCERWADDPERVAIHAETHEGTARTVTFAELHTRSNQLANYLREHGISRGDRVAVSGSQRPESLIGHLATWKLGAVSVPTSSLFGTHGLQYRFNDCGVKACLADTRTLETLGKVRSELEDLSLVLSIDDDTAEDDAIPVQTALSTASETFETVETDAEDTALIIYTSGTTGNPKGVVHAHRCVLGIVPTYVTLHLNMDFRGGERYYTPVEWAWVGSLLGGVLPGLFYGNGVVAYDAPKFDPTKTFELIESCNINTMLLPPTAVRKMAQYDNPDYEFEDIRAVVCGGEAVGKSIYEWVSSVFDAPVHDGYGQTEATTVICEVAALGVDKPGTMGKASLGHEMAVLDSETLEPVDDGEIGEIALRYEGDPTCFKEYWERPKLTDEKVRDGWLLTEDLGRRDEHGFFEFVGRKDDVIISSGYRIGPEEIEDCLSGHEAVVDAGVVGVPHEERGEIPRAFVILADGYEPGEDLVETLTEFCKQQLALYKYPREVEFVSELPQTPTGKIKRGELGTRDQ